MHAFRHFTHTRQAVAAAAFAALTCTGLSSAVAAPELIFGRGQQVPDAPAGARFNANSTFAVQWGVPSISPDGMSWGISALTRAAGSITTNNAILYGSGLTASDVIISGETFSVSDPFAAPLTSVTFQGTETSAGNIVVSAGDAGLFAFNARNSGVSGNPGLVVKKDGSSASVIVKSGVSGPIPGTTVLGVISTPATFGAVALDGSTGTVAYRGPLSPTTNSPFLGTGDGVSGTTGLLLGRNYAPSQPTVPAALGGTTGNWTSFSDSSLTYSANGDYLVAGKFVSDDEVVAVNNTVVVREGFALPGSADPRTVKAGSNDLFGRMSPSGAYLVRGRLSDDTSFQLFSRSDGETYVIARTGTDIGAMQGGLAGEVIGGLGTSIRFFGAASDNQDNFAYIASTRRPDPLNIGSFIDDKVLVFDNKFVLARTGDAIDLRGLSIDFNGDGILDTEAYITQVSPNADRLVLSDDGYAYFAASLRSTAASAGSVSYGEAWVRVAIPEPSSLGLVAAGLPLMLRRRRA